MKTNNNVQKAVLRSAAVVVSFVLISFTVSGQNFWKRLIINSSFNDLALAMVNTSGETGSATPASAGSALYVVEVEQAMEVENWMLDETTFDTGAFIFEEAVDPELELEEWMMDETIFQILENGEEKLELEPWMVDANVWSI